ncbi:uncharacterized protein EKO05_0001779 [Ascochyta rabiei]|uniref:uncharacterized protein n=1 Tax=Didymella rabiei TaxID=5454 RepID=UPI0021FA3339|nr:uncharacterized protein EKO05_0001779 [Ascochyta rabiei]UPX11157.1 hypothetical protein EKO05_0001779 [Ascochyta rabiei]
MKASIGLLFVATTFVSAEDFCNSGWGKPANTACTAKRPHTYCCSNGGGQTKFYPYSRDCRALIDLTFKAPPTLYTYPWCHGDGTIYCCA